MVYSVPMVLFQGEICVASSRVYVQEGIYDELVKKLVEKAKAWVVGDPFDPKVQQGPQVRYFRKFRQQITNSNQAGPSEKANSLTCRWTRSSLKESFPTLSMAREREPPY